jgi:ferritin-like metal-binding protein YciE
LNSPRAVELSLYVVRAFVRLRETLAVHKGLATKLEELEHDVQARALRRAFAEHVAETKRHRSFLNEAVRTDTAMQECGVGCAMPDARAYVAAKVRSEQVKRPNPVK